MKLLKDHTKNQLNNFKIKVLSGKPKLFLLIFFAVFIGLVFTVISNSGNKNKNTTNSNELKVEETDEFDDKYVKNEADMYGYKDNKGKNGIDSLTEEEQKKVFGGDPGFFVNKNIDTNFPNNSDNNSAALNEFLAAAGIDNESKKEEKELLDSIDNLLNVAADTPALPVLLLLDKKNNQYDIAGTNEKISAGFDDKYINLTEEQKQALIEKEKMLEEQKNNELDQALKSNIKVLDNSNILVAKNDNQQQTQGSSYEDQLKTAFDYTKQLQDPNASLSKEKEVLDNDFTLVAKVQKAKKGEIKTGFVIPATLVTEINSQLKGMILGQVRQNVYDTAIGNQLLIPQGTKLVGDYSSDVQFGAKRIFVNWKRLVFPNGSSLDLGSMPGADMSGTSGFRDKYNSHFWEMFGSSLLFSFVLTGVNMTQNPGIMNQFIPTMFRGITDSLSSSVGQSLGQTLSKMIEKYMDIAPDINIRPGYLFNVMVTKDIVLPEYKEN